MTSYLNFIQDFPTRAIQILDDKFDWAKANNREVTLMLSIAATSFIIPFERLRPISPPQPGADRDKYEQAKISFDHIINTKFLSSELWNEGTGWEFIKEITSDEVKKYQVDHWARPEIRQPLPKNMTTNSVVSQLRNAISHGSVFTYPSPQKQDDLPEIETLVFLSRIYEAQTVDRCKKCGEPIKDRVPVDKFRLLAVSPDNFHKFLKKWINFLKSLTLA